jgi:hypothetical protein
MWTKYVNIPNGVTKGRVAFEISRVIATFYEVRLVIFGVSMRELTVVQEMIQAHYTERDPAWHIQNVPFCSLKLAELRQVSTGSWQPVICRIL